MTLGGLYYFAQTSDGYGCSVYGHGGYNEACAEETTGTPSEGTGTTTTGSLQNTGSDIILPLIVSICLIIASLALLFKRKKKPAGKS